MKQQQSKKKKPHRSIITNHSTVAGTIQKNLAACSDSVVKVNAASCRREQFDGREHLIAPVVAVKEGVLNGMLVLYDEFSAYPSAWEGVPLPIYHPVKGSQRVTANTPDVLQSQVIGRMFNVQADSASKALKAELWIDLQKAQATDDGKEILRRLDAGEALEVSTGYFADLETTSGIHNGKAYESIQRNMRPDHVALLPGKKGACSWTDGCGAPRLNTRQPIVNNVKYLVTEPGGTTHLPVTGPDGTPDHRLMGAAWAALHNGYRGNKYTGPGKTRAIAKLKAMYKKEQMPLPAANEAEEPTAFHLTGNQDEFSHDDIAMMIRDALMDEDPSCYYYLSDVFDTYFVYTAESKNYVPPPASPAGLFKRDYTLGTDGDLQLGMAQAVVRKTSYVVEPSNNTEERIMKKEEIVAKLIAGGSWKEEHRALLMAANEKDLEKLLPVDHAVALAAKLKKETVDKIIVHERTPWKEENRAQLMTFDQEYLSALLPAPPAAASTEAAGMKPFANAEEFLKFVPAELRTVFKAGMTENQRRHAQLVQTLVGNSSCKFSKEELETMDSDFLEKVADSMNVSFVGRALPRLNDRARVANEGDGVPDPPKFMTAPITVAPK